MRGAGARAAAGPADAFQAVSAGRINVAIWPGALRATLTAHAPSVATSSAEADVRTQSDTGRAMLSMSDASGGSWRM